VRYNIRDEPNGHPTRRKRALTEAEKKKVPRLRVKEWRERRGWRQIDLAHAADIQPSTVSNIENGNYSPNLRLVAALADALEIDITDLFETPKPRRRVKRAEPTAAYGDEASEGG
jgi:putative transcriptional regulator